MSVQSDLIDFLVNLPASDSPDERRAMVIATGYPNLGIYLDWQGSNIEFFGRLLDEFGRRDQSALVKFLGGLDRAPQVSDERKPVLAELRSRVAALDAVGWQQEFVTGAAPTPALPLPDAAMLATTVVTQVLTPYFKLGAEGLREQAGVGNARLADQLSQALEQALAGDVAAGPVFSFYKQAPESAQELFLTVLKGKLAQDPTLARQLMDVMESAAREPGADLELLIDVSQTVQTVASGASVIGAVLGSDVMGKINAKISQKVDTVNGTLIGFQMQGP